MWSHTLVTALKTENKYNMRRSKDNENGQQQMCLCRTSQSVTINAGIQGVQENAKKIVAIYA